jgi:hypothetical protein
MAAANASARRKRAVIHHWGCWRGCRQNQNQHKCIELDYGHQGGRQARRADVTAGHQLLPATPCALRGDRGSRHGDIQSIMFNQAASYSQKIMNVHELEEDKSYSDRYFTNNNSIGD